jgi:hypothetical protein
VLQGASGNAVPGNLTIGAATARLNASNQIAGTATINLTGSSLLNTNSTSDTIAVLSPSSSSVTTGAGPLTIIGNVMDRPKPNIRVTKGKLRGYQVAVWAKDEELEANLRDEEVATTANRG